MKSRHKISLLDQVDAADVVWGRGGSGGPVNVIIIYPIAFKFCAEHGGDADMLCAKYENAWTIEMDVMYERVLAKFYIAQGPKIWTSRVANMDCWFCKFPLT